MLVPFFGELQFLLSAKDSGGWATKMSSREEEEEEEEEEELVRRRRRMEVADSKNLLR